MFGLALEAAGRPPALTWHLLQLRFASALRHDASDSSFGAAPTWSEGKVLRENLRQTEQLPSDACDRQGQLPLLQSSSEA